MVPDGLSPSGRHIRPTGTARYEWLVRLIEPLAKLVVLAHPQKLHVIAESTHKSDPLDAQVLAGFLALDTVRTS